MTDLTTRLRCWTFGHDLQPLKLLESHEEAVFRCRRCDTMKKLDVTFEPVDRDLTNDHFCKRSDTDDSQF